MGNISSLADISSAAGGLSGLILVTPQQNSGYQPQNLLVSNLSPQQLPPGFLFDYEGEQTVTLESDITDHFVENNTVINDQIALHPELITTQGFVGELNDIVPAPLKPLKAVADKLMVVSAYTPVLTAAAILAYDEAAFAYSVAINTANAVVSAWKSVSTQNKQQKAFQLFYGYWQMRTLFTIQTPWAIFDSMAIKTIKSVQDEKSEGVTNFECTFKKIRFAAIGNNTVYSDFQGRSAAQASGLVDNGTTTPPVAPQSLNSFVLPPVVP